MGSGKIIDYGQETLASVRGKINYVSFVRKALWDMFLTLHNAKLCGEERRRERGIDMGARIKEMERRIRS